MDEVEESFIDSIAALEGRAPESLRRIEKTISVSVEVTINTGNFTNIKINIGERFRTKIGGDEEEKALYAERIEALKAILREERKKIKGV